MKKSSFIIAAGLLFAALWPASSNAQQNEQEAIKKVIQQETSSFFHKDYAGLANTWAHDSADYITRSGPYGYSTLVGWNAISAEYKKDIANLIDRNDAEIAPFLNKKDFHFYINGNTAVVTFKEKGQTTNFETRTLIKEDNVWKILSLSVLNIGAYNMRNTIDVMKAFAGKWTLDGKPVANPPIQAELNNLKIELKITPNGLEELSNINYTYKDQSYTPPTEYEYFIPDDNTDSIYYMDIQKNRNGQVFIQKGTVTSNQPNSFTVTIMNPNDPAVKRSEYTATMQDGKWHQAIKHYGKDGKVVSTGSVDLHRL